MLSTAQAKTFIPALAGTSSEDSNIDQAVLEAVGGAARYCGVPAASAAGLATLASTSYTHRTHVGLAKIQRLDSDTLRLPVYPVTAITSITDDGTVVSSDDYELIGDEGTIRLKSTATHDGWSAGFGLITVVYTAGFSTIATSTPALFRAIGALVRHFYDLNWAQGIQAMSHGGGSETRRDEVIPKNIRQLLQSFRLRRSPYDPDFPRPWEPKPSEAA